MTAHEETLRRHYARTTLAKMGIDFERGMQHESVRILVEGAANAEVERVAAEQQNGALRAA